MKIPSIRTLYRTLTGWALGAGIGFLSLIFIIFAVLLWGVCLPGHLLKRLWKQLFRVPYLGTRVARWLVAIITIAVVSWLASIIAVRLTHPWEWMWPLAVVLLLISLLLSPRPEEALDLFDFLDEPRGD